MSQHTHGSRRVREIYLEPTDFGHMVKQFGYEITAWIDMDTLTSQINESTQALKWFELGEIHAKYSSLIVQALAQSAEKQWHAHAQNLEAIKNFSKTLANNANAKLYSHRLSTASISTRDYIAEMLKYLDRTSLTEEVATQTRADIAKNLSSQNIHTTQPPIKPINRFGPNTAINAGEAGVTAWLSGVGIGTYTGLGTAAGYIGAGVMGLAGAGAMTAALQKLAEAIDTQKSRSKSRGEKLKVWALAWALGLGTTGLGYGIKKGDEIGTIGATAYTIAANAKIQTALNSKEYNTLIEELRKWWTSNIETITSGVEAFINEEAKSGKWPGYHAKNILIHGSDKNPETPSNAVIRSALDTQQQAISDQLNAVEQQIQTKTPDFYSYLTKILSGLTLADYARQHGYIWVLKLLDTTVASYSKDHADIFSAKQANIKGDEVKSINPSIWSQNMVSPSKINGLDFESYDAAVSYGQTLKGDLESLAQVTKDISGASKTIAQAYQNSLTKISQAVDNVYAWRAAQNFAVAPYAVSLPDITKITSNLDTDISIQNTEEARERIQAQFGAEWLANVESFASTRGAVIAIGLLGLGGLIGMINIARRQKKFAKTNQFEVLKWSLNASVDSIIDQVYTGFHQELFRMSRDRSELIPRAVFESAVWSMLSDRELAMVEFAPAHVRSQLSNLPTASSNIKQTLEDIFQSLQLEQDITTTPKTSWTKKIWIGALWAIIGDKRTQSEKYYAAANKSLKTLTDASGNIDQAALSNILKWFEEIFAPGTPASESIERLALYGDTTHKAIQSITDEALRDEMWVHNREHSTALIAMIANDPHKLARSLDEQYARARIRLLKDFADKDKLSTLLSLKNSDIQTYVSWGLQRLEVHYRTEKDRLKAFDKQATASSSTSKKPSLRERAGRIFGGKTQIQKSPSSAEEIFRIAPFPEIETLEPGLTDEKTRTAMKRFLETDVTRVDTLSVIIHLLGSDPKKFNQILTQSWILWKDRESIINLLKGAGGFMQHKKKFEGERQAIELSANSGNIDSLTLSRRVDSMRKEAQEGIKYLESVSQINAWTIENQIDQIAKSILRDTYQDLIALDPTGESVTLQAILQESNLSKPLSAVERATLTSQIAQEVTDAQKARAISQQIADFKEQFGEALDTHTEDQIRQKLNESDNISATAQEITSAMQSHADLDKRLADRGLTEYSTPRTSRMDPIDEHQADSIVEAATEAHAQAELDRLYDEDADDIIEKFGELIWHERKQEIKEIIARWVEEQNQLVEALNAHAKTYQSIEKEWLWDFADIPKIEKLSDLASLSGDEILNKARAKKWRKEMILDPIKHAADQVNYTLSPADHLSIEGLQDEESRDAFIKSLQSRKALIDARERLASEGFDQETIKTIIEGLATKDQTVEWMTNPEDIINYILQLSARKTLEAYEIPSDTPPEVMRGRTDFEAYLGGQLRWALEMLWDNVPQAKEGATVAEYIDHLQAMRDLKSKRDRVNEGRPGNPIEWWNAGAIEAAYKNSVEKKRREERTKAFGGAIDQLLLEADGIQPDMDLDPKILTSIRSSLMREFIEGDQELSPQNRDNLLWEYYQRKVKKMRDTWAVYLQKNTIISAATKESLRGMSDAAGIKKTKDRLKSYEAIYPSHQVMMDQEMLGLDESEYGELIEMITTSPDVWRLARGLDISLTDTLLLAQQTGQMSTIQERLENMAHVQWSGSSISLPDAQTLLEGLTSDDASIYQSWILK